MTKLASNPAKYAELISQSEEQKAAGINDLLVKEAQHELQGHLIKVQQAIQTSKRKVIEAKSAKPYSARAIYLAQVEVDKLVREETFLVELEKEQF